MNFSYTYAPNLIHQGASIITKISSANGYKNPSSSLLIIAIISYCSEYILLQNCHLPLSSLPPRALQLSTSTPHSFFDLHDMIMGHAHLVCTQFIFTHLMEGRVLPVPFFSKGLLYMVPLFLSLTTPFSVKETLMDFGYTYAPNLIHQGASIITEISSAHGEKNSASSKQQ